MKKGYLFLLLIYSTCLVVNAQEFDEASFWGFSKPEKKWRWKYYPVAEVLQKNDLQIIKINLGNHENYGFEDRIKKREDYKYTPSGKIANFTLQLSTTDSLEVLKPYSKTGQSSGTLLLPLFKATFIDNRVNFSKTIEYEVPIISSQIVVKGDMVAFDVENKMYNDSLLFYRLEDFLITLMDIHPKPFFNVPQYPKSAAADMEVAKILIADMKEGAVFYKDKLTGPFIQTGPYAGKSVSEILNAAIEKDVIDCAHFILSYPRKYMGRQVKFAEAYADWILAKQPKGRFSFLKVVDEYSKWVEIKPMRVDIDSGRINGIPLQKALANWKHLFPWYDGDEKDYPENSSSPYFDYNLIGNALTYFPKQKALKILLVGHQYYKLTGLKEYTSKEIIQKFGQPARIIGNIKSPESYLYSRPFGTIGFNFNSFTGTATLVYLYPVKPHLVEPADN